MITIATRCEDRKEMVRKISERLNLPAVYMRTPTYAFQIGEITVNRDASVSGEPEQLIPAAECLLDNGYIDELPGELYGTADSEAAAEEPADTYTGTADRISVSIPLGACTPQGLINILRMVYTRQTLIRAMTRCDYISVDEELISLLSEMKPESISQISELLKKESDIGLVTVIAVEDDKLTMDTTYDRDNPTGWNSFAELLITMSAKAMKAHHVSGNRIEPEAGEMKYFCRNWLMQLGMGGADFKASRAALLKHLTGYAAFRTSEKMNAHIAKYTEMRRALKESEETVNEADR